MAKKNKSKKPVGEGKPRRFVYEEFSWDDPGDDFTDDDVLAQVAAYIPALAGGSVTRNDKGDYVEVTFAPKPKKLG